MSDDAAVITGLTGLPGGPADTGILVIPRSRGRAGPAGYWWDPDLARVLAAVANPVWLRPVKPRSGNQRASEPPAGASEQGGHTQFGPDDEAEAALAAAESGDWPALPMGAVAGRVVETMAPGPGLAAWLASGAPEEIEDGAQAGVTMAWHRLASWAQAGELASVARMAAQAAARDDGIPVAEDGRPASIPRDAASEVAFALGLPESTAAGWADLAVTLSWRLRATLTALQHGSIDLYRARLIADATAVLDEPSARIVETEVLPKAGEQTSGQLRAALRRAAIRVDPDAADKRRKDAERRARVCLFGDDDGTATLSGRGLPGPGAAAAMARITAMARALKASGAGGGLDLLRAQIYLGLLLGTMPLIPPAKDGPPDPDLPSDPNGPPDSGGPPNPNTPPDDSADLDGPGEPGELRDRDGPAASTARAWREDDDWPPTDDPVPAWPPLPDLTEAIAGRSPVRGTLDLTVSWRALAGLSPEPGQLSLLGSVTGNVARLLAEVAGRDPLAEWRVIVVDGTGTAMAVARVPRTRARSPGSGPGHGMPGSGLVRRVSLIISLDVAGRSDLGELKSWAAQYQDAGDLNGFLVAALKTAGTLSTTGDPSAAGSAGGCGHLLRSTAYRPPLRLREFVVARDQTCRSPSCRRPAGQGDLDHTVPFGNGGVTCSCNLGGFCRSHHRLKQHPHWQVSQPAPGTFVWTTPSGRQYVTRPDPYQI